MRLLRNFGLILALLLTLAAPTGFASPLDPPFRALLFTKTAGYRHTSIPAGIAAIQKLAAQHNFTVDATEDASRFTDAGLAPYNVVIFLSTTGDFLDADQQAAFQRYIEHGGGFAGIHAAADAEYDWPWYGQLVGAYFADHPAIQPATVVVADRVNPSTAPLPRRWVRTDEWYNFRTNPRGTVHVLATLDERTYSGGTMGFDHPISWCQKFDGGRSWYTGLGHTDESFSDPLFLAHLLGGIQTAAGVLDTEWGATVEARFQQVVLDSHTLNPMEMSLAPDGRVFFIERGGSVKIYKPDTQSTVVAGHLDVSTTIEDGLLGIALDPNFAMNGWLYLFYSPAGSVAEQHISRFTVHGDTLDPGSEKILLRIPTQRQECCHSAGSLIFGNDGDLYISVGDNTNPFESNGFDPIDERPGRSPWDAQKSASNTNDLRGKILRIHPLPDGSYSVPDGNLFPADGTLGRPEIYVMGCRNPFRMVVDPATGWLYWGDVGPDALADDPLRGPTGYDEFNQARGPGNYGWPYFVADNKPYRDYDFDTGQSGDWFDPAAPVNDSPNNTGARLLPPAQPAWIWYPYGPSAQFPELGTGGRTGLCGPFYHYDPALQSDVKLPAYYDNTLFIFEWSRGWIKEVKLDDAGGVLKINPVMPHTAFRRPIDLKIGPDGALYMLEWGTVFGGDNTDSQLSRIEFVHGDRAPVAHASADGTNGPAPLTVHFSSAGSFDPDPGDRITFAWSFESSGATDSTDPNPSHTYIRPGNYTARLTVTDLSGKTSVATLAISNGNTAPVVHIDAPANGSFFQLGDTIPYHVTATDAEDGPLACSRIIALAGLNDGMDVHPVPVTGGCAGVIDTAQATGLTDTSDLLLTLTASATDNGAPGVAPLTSQDQVILQPRRKQAEDYNTISGARTAPTTDPEGGGLDVGYIVSGSFIAFSPMNLVNVGSITYRVSSGGLGGQIEVHEDAPDGPTLSAATIPVTGSWSNYTSITAPISDPGGAHTLYFVFRGSQDNQYLFNLNWIDFNPPATAPVPGDLNGDGKVTVADALLALRLAVGLGTPTADELRAGDLNGDGRVDIADATAILRKALGF